MIPVQATDKLQQVILRAAQLEGMRMAESSRMAAVEEAVAQAKGRASLNDEVVRVFEALQARAHERSVGAFERLLTALLNDVLPGEGAVKLLPQVKNNTTWLDIAIDNDGHLEDLVDGNGGAVTNVVCAGLRYAALSRTGNRRLMVLDEPHCWTKPEVVPTFINVVAQVAQQTKTQTLLVTHHHHLDAAEANINVVKFDRNGAGRVIAVPMGDLRHQWHDDQQPGLRMIELFNVRTHEHTKVPCFPCATAYIGDNNLGKSTAISSALRAVAYGESDDRLIRHGCDEARVVLHLEDGLRVEWSRSKKRGISVMYRLCRGTEVLQEGRQKSRGIAPEWVTQALKIDRVDDLDIQISNQKTPVFLLNDTASKRAQILSVGRESSHLKGLMSQYDEIKSQDRETIKTGELELARLKYRAGYLKKFDDIVLDIDLLACTAQEYAKQGVVLEKIGETLSRLESRFKAEASSSRMLKTLEALPSATPRLHDLEPLAKLGKEIGARKVVAGSLTLDRLAAWPSLAREDILASLIADLQKGAKFEALPTLIQMPPDCRLTDEIEVQKVLTKLTKNVKMIESLSKVTIPDLPVSVQLNETHRVTDILTVLARAADRLTATTAEFEGSDALAKQALTELNETKEALGGVCPLCSSPNLPHDHDHSH